MANSGNTVDAYAEGALTEENNTEGETEETAGAEESTETGENLENGAGSGTSFPDTVPLSVSSSLLPDSVFVSPVSSSPFSKFSPVSVLSSAPAGSAD